jgi:hypothetical protein
MGTALAVRETQIQSLDDLQRIAQLLAASGYFDTERDNKTAVAQVATKILAGQEMGYGPFTSVQGIHVIKGKPVLSANIMAAAVKGHPRYDYRVREMSDKKVAIEFFENGESLGTSSFTADEASKAGTQNMGKFPRNMLFARAMSNGVKWYCPDVFSGNTVYTADELGATVDEDTGEIIEQPSDPVRVVEPQQPERKQIANNGSAEHRTQREPAQAPVVAVVEQPKAEQAATVVAEQPTATDGADPIAAIIAENKLATPPTTQTWAINAGYCTNEFHARKRWLNIVNQNFGGKPKPTDTPAIVRAFVAKCLAEGTAQPEQAEAVAA